MAEQSIKERVANAVHAVLERHGILLVGTDWIPELGSAAIEAMREPTEAMVKAGAFNPWDGADEMTAEIAWEAMIDAALSPSPSASPATS